MTNENKEKMTVTIDKGLTEKIEKKRREKGISKSQLIRKALGTYFEFQEAFREIEEEKLRDYASILSEEDHMILDRDRWLTLLEHAPLDNDDFREKNKQVAKAHKTEFSPIVHTPGDLLQRLEKFKLFTMKETSENRYLLSTDSVAVDYVEKIIRDYAEILDMDIETEKSLSKIRIKAKDTH